MKLQLRLQYSVLRTRRRHSNANRHPGMTDSKISPCPHFRDIATPIQAGCCFTKDLLPPLLLLGASQRTEYSVRS